MTETTNAATPRPVDSDTDTSVGSDATVRDRVWDATLDLLARRPIPFQAWRVRKRAGLDSSQDRTIRRTLTVMADAGWLEHEPNSKWWYPGPKADRWLCE